MPSLKLLVTGAGGGVGSHVARRAMREGHDVIGVDLKPPYARDFPWRYADLSDRDAVMRLLEGVDAVLHLGEIPNVYGPFSADEVFAQNTRIGSTVFQCAVYQGVRRIVYASTAQTYGCWGDVRLAPERLPLDEEHPLRPQNAYAMSKAANEGYLRMLASQDPSLNVSAMRFPGVVGIWWPWEVFVERLRPHKDDRDGHGTYIHVEDVASGFVAALTRQDAGFRAYNLMADDVATLTPVQEYLPEIWPGLRLPEDHPPFASWVNCDRAKTELHWHPSYNVHQAHAALQGS